MICSCNCIIGFAAIVVVTYIASVVYHRLVLRIGEEATVTMHDGTKLTALSGDVGAAGVYKEMFEDHVYFEHGVTLEGIEAPIVIDAGVNIGLFSRYIAQTFPKARVFGAEPIDVLVKCARKNNAKFGDRVQILESGLGKTAGEMTIDFKPTLTSASTMHTADVKEAASKNLIDWVCGLTLDGFRLRAFPAVLAPIATLLRIPYVRVATLIVAFPVALPILMWKIGASLPTRPKKCKIVPMSTMLTTLGAPKTGPIHLLKIDVEGAEELVLEGIEDNVWARVQQCVVEVHDVRGRVERVKKLLEQKGFKNAIIDIEVWEVHRLLNVATVFARK
jgi:31-O-methyltransferase